MTLITAWVYQGWYFYQAIFFRAEVKPAPISKVKRPLSLHFCGEKHTCWTATGSAWQHLLRIFMVKENYFHFSVMPYQSSKPRLNIEFLAVYLVNSNITWFLLNSLCFFHFFHVCLFRNNFSKVADKKLRWNVSDLWCFKRYLWTLIVNNRPSRDKQQTNWIVLCKYRLFTLQSVSLRKTLQRVGGFIKANSEVGGKFKTVCFESNKLKAN